MFSFFAISPNAAFFFTFGLTSDSYARAWGSLADQVVNSLASGLGAGAASGAPWHLALLHDAAPSTLSFSARKSACGSFPPTCASRGVQARKDTTDSANRTRAA